MNLPRAESVLQELVHLLQGLSVKPVVVRQPGHQLMVEARERGVHPIGY